MLSNFAIQKRYSATDSTDLYENLSYYSVLFNKRA